jgi:hypothetical protein
MELEFALATRREVASLSAAQEWLTLKAAISMVTLGEGWAWLPHRTMLEEKEEVAASGEGAVSGDARDVGDACHRLHHTAYVRAGTEVAACVMHTYLTRPASTKDVPWPCRAC